MSRTAAQQIGERLRGREQPGDATVLLAGADAPAEHGGHAQGLMAVAVALAGAFGEREDWPAPWRELLRAPRRHPVPDMRDAALEETTAHE